MVINLEMRIVEGEQIMGHFRNIGIASYYCLYCQQFTPIILDALSSLILLLFTMVEKTCVRHQKSYNVMFYILPQNVQVQH